MTESKYLARSTDPGTSQEAAESAVKSGMVAAHCDLILGALVAHGPQSASSIAVRTHLHPHQVMKRLSDLGRKQLAAPTGDKIGGQRVWARDRRDIESDPTGVLIVPPSRAAEPIQWRFIEFNGNRAMRGVPAARLAADGVWLWMTPADIRSNIKDHGDHAELQKALAAYKGLA